MVVVVSKDGLAGDTGRLGCDPGGSGLGAGTLDPNDRLVARACAQCKLAHRVEAGGLLGGVNGVAGWHGDSLEGRLKGLDGGLDFFLLLFGWRGARDEGGAHEETAVQAGEGWKVLAVYLLVLLIACQHGELERGVVVDDVAGPEGGVRVDALEEVHSALMPYPAPSLPGR